MNTLKEQLDNSERIYQDRIHGESQVWSATTHCKVCDAKWLWGVGDNLDFVCDNCKSKICPNCGSKCYQNLQGKVITNGCDNCEWCNPKY